MIAVATSMVLTAFAADMFIYDEGNVYSCPSEHILSKLVGVGGEDAANEKSVDDQGKSFKIDPISHREFEDWVYDPMACRPFY